MSLRRKRILIPNNVTATLNNQIIEIDGPKGQTNFLIPELVSVKIIENRIFVEPLEKNLKKSKSLAGLTCKQIANNLLGVVNNIEYRLELKGVGYRAQIKGTQIELSLGYSHPNLIDISSELKVSVISNTEIIIQGINKSVVGLLAAQIRRLRPPEPYKGKGIFYKGEKILLKAGKSGKK
jgi:large subunit ribosomal protein L6